MEVKIFQERRQVLMNCISDGWIVLAANHPAPRNYAANCYPFRQDSTFLYYSGLQLPEAYLLLDPHEGETYLVAHENYLDDAIWTGVLPSLNEVAAQAGITHVLTRDQFESQLTDARKSKTPIHYLPPYSGECKIALSQLLQIPITKLTNHASEALIRVVIDQRSLKSEKETRDIEQVLNTVTGPVHKLAARLAQPGRYEYEVVAAMQTLVAQHNAAWAYPPICSVRGEVLHNVSYTNLLKAGQLLLVDAGAESAAGYASDITRTFPVGGRFTTQQKEIYQIVLQAQEAAINAIQPGIMYRDVHFVAAREITSGLHQLGLIRGNLEEALAAGAHTLFYMHGIGHMLGLDVHDMEDLGTHRVGFDKQVQPVSDFGTVNLRLGRELKAGFVVTVEPGIYFNSVLIDQWKTAKKLDAFIDYSKLSAYTQFGGIRIEDNLLVTGQGSRILGNPIPKSIADLEALAQSGS